MGDNVLPSQGWSGEYGQYDTDKYSVDSDDEMESLEGRLIDEWNTDDVLVWLEREGLNAFKQGFKDQKIDGMCLKEGLSETELNTCLVRTVGEKRLLKRKIAELVGHEAKEKVPKLPRLSKNRSVPTTSLSPRQKEDLLRRRKQVHRKTIAMFPGNNIPIFRGNPSAKKRLEDLSNKCQDQLNPDIGYDEEELRRHIRAILDERRRMVKEGYNYEEKSSDDESKRSLSPILVETVNIKKETLSDEGSKGSDEYCTQRPIETDESDDESQNGIKLPGGMYAASMPLTTAETIILAYFNKGYTKEVKKDLHIVPMCRELKIKNIKSKDKGELMVLLATELLVKKRVTLKDDADFYCLHRESVNVIQKAS